MRVKISKRLQLSFIWSVAPKSMTYFEEEDTRYKVELSDSLTTMKKESIDFKNALYLENYANSSTNVQIVFS